MGVNLDNMRKTHAEYNRKSEFLKIKSGDTVLYVHPPCRPEDKDSVTAGLNFLRTRVHYNVGENNNMVMCLDKSKKKNTILKHPFVVKFLEERGIEVSDGPCPVCARINTPGIDPEEADSMRPQWKYAWGVTPLKHREDSTSTWTPESKEPGIIFVGKTIYDGLMELFYDNGDITDVKNAIFAKIKKIGTGFTTKYKVDADIESLKKPKVLPEGFVRKLNESFEDKCDLYRLIADMVRDENEVAAMFSGVPLADDEEDLADVDDGWGSESTTGTTQSEELDDVFGDAPVEKGAEVAASGNIDMEDELAQLDAQLDEMM